MASRRIRKMKKKNPDVFTLITGASAGIGRALAVEGAKRGWNLALIALPGEKLQEISESLEKTYHIKTKFFEIDLTDKKAPQLVHEWCQKMDIQVGRLINNAGVGMGDKFSSLPYEFYEKMMLLNMVSLVCLTRLFLPELGKYPTAFILNSGSLAGFYPSPYKTVYAASKSFVNMFSLALREELCQSGISVSVLCPGSVPTNDAVKKRIPKNGYLARAAVLSSERVARIALEKLEKGKAIIIPGFVNKLYYFLGYVFPFKLRAKFLSRLFRKYYISGNGN